MPIVVQGLTSTTTEQASLTAQDIVNCVSQDVRSVLANNGNDATILLDFVNRTHYRILRDSRWAFLMSQPQYLITERMQNDYWLGPVGQGPTGMVDTGLNLTDVDNIKKDSVLDISNDKVLAFTPEKNYKVATSFPDAQSRPGRPTQWRQDPQAKNILSIYPAPDNSSLYQPVPQAPYLSVVAGGSLPQRTYYVTLTFVDTYGNEGTACVRENQIIIPANYLVVVNPPQLPFSYSAESASAATGPTSTYNQYNIYASTTSLAEKLQTVTPLFTTTTWTEPTSGLTTTGVTPPITSKLTVMDGYIITFRYFVQRTNLSALTTPLQVPDVYKDIMCAGTNFLATQYLRLKDEAQMWYGIFNDGLRQMIKDRNLFPKGVDYIQPDEMGIGIGNQQPYIDTYEVFR